MNDQGDTPDGAPPMQDGFAEAMEEARRISTLFKEKMRMALDDDLKEFSDNPHVNYTNVLLLQLCRNTGGQA